MAVEPTPVPATLSTPPSSPTLRPTNKLFLLPYPSGPMALACIQAAEIHVVFSISTIIKRCDFARDGILLRQAR